MYLPKLPNVFVFIAKLKHPVPSGGKGWLVSFRAGVKPGQADCFKQCSSEGRGNPDLSPRLICILWSVFPYLHSPIHIPSSVFAHPYSLIPVLSSAPHPYILIHISSSVFPHLYSHIRIPSYVFPHRYSLIDITPSIFPHLYSIVSIPTSVFPHPYSNIRIPSFIFPHPYFSSIFHHPYSLICILLCRCATCSS